MSGETRAGVASGGRLGWVVAYALATALSFPHHVGDGPVDLGPAAAWLGPAFLVAGLRGLPPRRAAALAFLGGWLAHSAIFHWIYVVTVYYGHAPAPVGVIAAVGLALYPAAFVAAFGAAAAGLARGGAVGPWTAAVLWAVLDHARTFVLTGFPWALLGYAQHGNPPLLGLAPWTGVHGLSFVTALGGAALAHLVLGPRRGGRRRSGALALAAVAALHALGMLAAPSPADGPRVRMAVVQGNIDQGVKWSPDWAERTLSVYEAMTRRAAAAGARVVVWPETAVPGAPDRSPELRARLAALARETGSWLVVGAVGLEGPPLRYFDSAFVVDPGAGVVDRYDKAHLVPFGEYVPLRDVLGFFVTAVARGIASTDVSAGAGPRVSRLAPEGAPSVPAGLPICYELLFPDLVRRFAGDGAEVLLALTNDAWYGRTGAPHQFLAITALRSAETGVWTARAANTGVSAFIDGRGRVRARTRIFEEAFLVEDVPLRRSGATFYTRHGDVFAAGCWIAAAALGLAARRGKSHERE